MNVAWPSSRPATSPASRRYRVNDAKDFQRNCEAQSGAHLCLYSGAWRSFGISIPDFFFLSSSTLNLPPRALVFRDLFCAPVSQRTLQDPRAILQSPSCTIRGFFFAFVFHLFLIRTSMLCPRDQRYFAHILPSIVSCFEIESSEGKPNPKRMHIPLCGSVQCACQRMNATTHR